MTSAVSRERLERAARVYKTNRQASVALGIATRTFTRQCERLGVVPPSRRRRQDRKGSEG